MIKGVRFQHLIHYNFLKYDKSATWEGLANSDGSCSAELANIMLELAKGQVGLIITSHALVGSKHLLQEIQ
ncbi:unnamed protein product, partial [marine sediment metagenome]